jgi:HSP20 family protein
MTRRDPFGEIEELFERMDREFEKLGDSLDTPGGRTVPVDVIEDAEAVTVLADLPGFTADEISVELDDEALTVAATPAGDAETGDADAVVADEPAGDGPQYHRRERRRGSASRRIPLPAAVEPDAATAAHDDGVLTVTLPKRSASDDGGHRIDVE